jgi:hypothetical protein
MSRRIIHARLGVGCVPILCALPMLQLPTRPSRVVAMTGNRGLQGQLSEAGISSTLHPVCQLLGNPSTRHSFSRVAVASHDHVFYGLGHVWN